jgi:hypothetical protein
LYHVKYQTAYYIILCYSRCLYKNIRLICHVVGAIVKAAIKYVIKPVKVTIGAHTHELVAMIM